MARARATLRVAIRDVAIAPPSPLPSERRVE
jgi:hypothetical protein